MSRIQRGTGKRFSYSEPIIPMASKVQGDPDDYFVSDARQGPAYSARRPNAASGGTPLENAGSGPSDAQNAAFSNAGDAADGSGAVGTMSQKKVERCPLRGNAMKCGFVVCAVLVVAFAVAYLLLKWRKRRKKRAEDALLKSFILPEADRKFLEDAAAREKEALQSAT